MTSNLGKNGQGFGEIGTGDFRSIEQGVISRSSRDGTAPRVKKVGNLLGSNIFNILLVLPASLLVSQRAFITDSVITADYSMVFVASTIFVILLLWRQKVGCIRAGILIGAYAAYMLLRMLFFN